MLQIYPRRFSAFTDGAARSHMIFCKIHLACGVTAVLFDRTFFETVLCCVTVGTPSVHGFGQRPLLFSLP